MPPLGGIIFSRHILYECIQKSLFHLDCMGFNLILLLIKKIRCGIFNNRKASLHGTQWLRLKWRLSVPFAVLEEHSYSNKSRHHQFMLHRSVQLCICMHKTKLQCSYSFLMWKLTTFFTHFFLLQLLNIVEALIYFFWVLNPSLIHNTSISTTVLLYRKICAVERRFSTQVLTIWLLADNTSLSKWPVANRRWQSWSHILFIRFRPFLNHGSGLNMGFGEFIPTLP